VNAAAWRASLRIARREAWRAKGRSLLVIALIGLPVLVLTAADICYRTWQLDPTEKLNRSIGSADASVAWYGSPVQQSPNWPDGGWTAPGLPDQQPPTPSTSKLLAVLPPASRAIERHRSYNVIDTLAGKKNALINGLDYTDPIARGLVRQISGRAPRTATEIAFTRSLAHDSGWHVGDTVHVAGVQFGNGTPQADRSYQLVGIVADASRRHAGEAYTLPSAFQSPHQAQQDWDEFNWLIDTTSPVTWNQVLGLNKLGYFARSRQVYLHPPPKSEVLYNPGTGTPISTKLVATGTLIGGMALLEVVLLAGPAFAVGARRQRRELALVAAVGGRRSDLRNIVLSKGVVLGVAGGVISVACGVALTAIGIATLAGYVDAIPGHLDVRPAELLALTLVSLLTALAAAVFPARGAARTDVVAALAGRRGTVRTRKRVPVLGVVVAAVGVLVALGASAAHTSSARANLILAGVALTEVGLIICTPALVGLVARSARWLPLSPRIALRDAGRNRSSAAPAIAAVMAAVIGSVSLAVSVASVNDHDRRQYQQQLPMNDGFFYVARDDDASKAAAAVRAELPGSHTVTVSTIDNGCEATPNDCATTDITPPSATSWPSRGGFVPAVVIDDGSDVGTMLQTRDPQPAAALRAGKAVLTVPSAVHDGRTTLRISTSTNTSTNSSTASKDVVVPAVFVSQADAFVSVIIPPSLATRIGVRWTHVGVYVDTARRPTDREEQAVAGGLSKISPDLQMYVETGYHNSTLWMLLALVIGAGVITIGATAIATALSNVDGRSDLTTLGAVGAAPRTRRLLSMSRAGVIAGVGTGLGTVAGFVPAYAWIRAQVRSPDLNLRGASFYAPGPDGPARMHLVVPWLPLTATVVVVPLAAVLVAGLFSRSRLPSERPAD
jgi:putative ABC transport system permease protein